MKKILLVILTVAWITPAAATIINIPDEYPTIQEGIDVSTDGDTVLVQPGTYVENINFNGHNIVLGSLFFTTGDTSYIEHTVIDGDSLGSVVTFNHGENDNAELIGFAIYNGLGGESYPSYYGGGITCNNTNPIIKHNIISRNYTTGYESRGGGIYCMQANPIITENIISNNSAVQRGGGISCSHYANPIITENEFIGNSVMFGGAIECYFYSSPNISNNIFISNSAYYGGAISLFSACNPIIKNNDFYSNIALTDNAFGGYGGAIHWGYSHPIISENRIYSNTATYGGGISFDDCAPSILNNLILNNSSVYGGGIYGFHNAYPYLINNTLYRNFADYGGGIYYSECWNTLAENNILSEDSAAMDGNEIYFYGGVNIEFHFSNVQGGWPGSGNIDVDPFFRDAENGDFHLMSTACGDPYDSPCIDAGDPALIDSLLDCPWGLGELRSDMGAYGGGDSAMVAIDDIIQRLPSQLALLQNYPNPFNSSTTICYTLPERSDVRIEIYNILGQRVATLLNRVEKPGNHSIFWDASDHSSGVYFARMDAAGQSEKVKIVLLR